MLTEQGPVTGWERHVDVDDTMLRRFLTHHAALCATFTLAGCGRALAADDVTMADLGRPGGHFNGAVLLRPPADWNRLLTRIERFAAGGRGQFVLWSAWPTPDLLARGWRLSGHPPLLVRPPLAAYPLSTAGADDLDVRRVTSVPDLAAWERVAIAAYPLPGLADAPAGGFIAPALLDDDRLRFFVGRDGARAVAAAVSFSSHGIASFAFGATLPIVRRRGFWRQTATARLAATPDVWFAGLFSDHSRPGAEALGFVPVLRLTLWTLDRP
jgi:hypothetical protein